MAVVEQDFPRPRAEPLLDDAPLKPLEGARVAVAVGSRGIAGLADVVQAVVARLHAWGGRPFIVPAMGSHGGASAEGQIKILAGYGISQATLGVPVVATMETVELGTTSLGTPVFLNRAAAESAGIVPVNRVKPHTDFTGKYESGLMKMMAVGLGAADGARSLHRRGHALGHGALIEATARVVIDSGAILMGVAVVENAYHEAARVQALRPEEIPTREPELLAEARALMPRLPVDALDVLVVDRIGKDISGAGLDPNVTGRRFKINSVWQEKPDITRIVVLGLSEGSGGNAVGLGLADFCAARAVAAIDRASTYANVLTAGNVCLAHVPPHYESDREVLEAALASCGEGAARVARIRDTLSLAQLEVSEALLPELEGRVRVVSEPAPMIFDERGTLC